MALSNFFKINLPYGIMRNDKGYWTSFNREYMPLGENDSSKHVLDSDFVYTNYGKLSERFLMDLADDPSSAKLNEKNVIVKVFLYDDATNPSNHTKDNSSLWLNYFDKLKKLASQKVK